MNLTFENVSDDHAVLMMEWYTALTNNMMGKITDGYHTFDELYHHRAVLFSVICNIYKESAWKSKMHHDGSMYDGMFIVGINTPEGQATYHYDLEPYWDMFQVKEVQQAPEWDGHSAGVAIERIGSLDKSNKKEFRMILTEDQARITSIACEFYARVRMGQFNEIPFHCLEWNGNTDNICERRDEADRLLLEARKQLYPELHGIGHSYGTGKFKDADQAFDVYQVIRHEFGDDRPPFSYYELPKCERINERPIGGGAQYGRNRETDSKVG